MRIFRLAVVATMLLLAPSVALAKDPKYDIKEVAASVAEQQSSDPVIGIWSGGSGGYNWQVAIIRNPVNDGYAFIGVMLKPWPGFKSGELILRLNKARSASVYEGSQKWKAGWSSSWRQARFALNGDTRAVQYNNINFETPIGSDWNLFKEQIASPLRKTEGKQSYAYASTSAEGKFDANVFVWFDEASLAGGPPVRGQAPSRNTTTRGAPGKPFLLTWVNEIADHRAGVTIARHEDARDRPSPLRLRLRAVHTLQACH